MRFDEDNYDNRKNPFVPAIVGTSFALLLVVLIVFATNSTKHSGKVQTETSPQSDPVTEETQPEEVQASKKRAQDLNFWGMYPEDEVKKEKETVKPQSIVSAPQPKEEDIEQDAATDGKHVKVVLDDGSSEWLAINKNIPANYYEDTSFQKEDGIMKYYQDSRLASYAGVFLDHYSGTVDFEKLKEEGISFVMIHAGSRGYESGLITTDESFETYMREAQAAGMDVGVCFTTQAINANEAAEEAQYVLRLIEGYRINYPIAVEMSVVTNEIARTDGMSKNDRTTVLKTFMEEVGNAGYTPLLMGNKNFMLTKIDLVALSGFGMWLDNCSSLPEYPYKFGMWQYTDKGVLEGMKSEAKLNISLVDYASR